MLRVTGRNTSIFSKKPCTEPGFSSQRLSQEVGSQASLSTHYILTFERENDNVQKHVSAEYESRLDTKDIYIHMHI